MNEPNMMQPIEVGPVATAPKPAAADAAGYPPGLAERAKAAQAAFHASRTAPQMPQMPSGMQMLPSAANPYPSSGYPLPQNGPVADPLSQPFRLPSSGLFYQNFVRGHTGEILISPTRGEQEEILASAQEVPGARAPALRHVTSQCFQTNGVPFPELLLLDWNAALLQFYAQSIGDDEIQFGELKHPGCGQIDTYSLKLSSLPSVALRVAGPGETPNWPSAEAVDLDVRAILAVEGKSGVTTRVVSPADATEPFKVRLKGGTEIAWRYARVRDLVTAEEFVAEVGGIGAAEGIHSGKFNNFLTALHIVSINGKVLASAVEAIQWVKMTPSFVLEGLRRAILDRSFGYDMEPRLRCKGCGGSWKVALPTDGATFRSTGS